MARERDDLKPCPRCGSTDHLDIGYWSYLAMPGDPASIPKNYGEWMVSCKNCQFIVLGGGTKEAGIKSWNRYQDAVKRGITRPYKPDSLWGRIKSWFSLKPKPKRKCITLVHNGEPFFVERRWVVDE